MDKSKLGTFARMRAHRVEAIVESAKRAGHQSVQIFDSLDNSFTAGDLANFAINEMGLKVEAKRGAVGDDYFIILKEE